MQRVLALAFGTVSYGVFFASFLYLIGFLSGFVVPKTIDSGTAAALGHALLIDTALVVAFGLQHSIMARPRFKAWWTRFVPAPIERSTYVLASSAVLIALYAWWQPIASPVWDATSPIARGALTALFFAGVGLVLYATFLIDHFDLFGLRQVVLYFRKRSYSERHFVMPVLYRFIRHPLYLGWFITFWATPTMSAGRRPACSRASVDTTRRAAPRDRAPPAGSPSGCRRSCRARRGSVPRSSWASPRT